MTEANNVLLGLYVYYRMINIDKCFKYMVLKILPFIFKFLNTVIELVGISDTIYKVTGIGD